MVDRHSALLFDVEFHSDLRRDYDSLDTSILRHRFLYHISWCACAAVETHQHAHARAHVIYIYIYNIPVLCLFWESPLLVGFSEHVRQNNFETRPASGSPVYHG